jgi:hypothetical protein
MAESGAAQFEIVEIGPVARRVLVDGASGRVEAVFERSFYVVVQGHWVCLGPEALGSGPLNALYRPLPPNAARLCRPASREGVRVLGHALQVGRGIFIGLERAPEPSPTPTAPWSAATLAAGLQAFDALDGDLFPGEGLAPLCRPGAGRPESALLAVADGPAARLADLVREAAAGVGVENGVDAGSLEPLVGLGPGLTPSGDDLLGGALVALQAVGLEPLRDAVWAALRARAEADTNAISLAHLAAAAEGQCSAALRRILNRLMTGATGDLRGCLRAVGDIGHTSGWDALAGLLTVLRAFRDTRCHPGAARPLTPSSLH